MIQQRGYLRDFAGYWSTRPEARKIWFSLFTPQEGQPSEERLGESDRELGIQELATLSLLFPKVHMPRLFLDGYSRPPRHPGECIFAEITTRISADLRTEVGPCELGRNLACRECGCIASARGWPLSAGTVWPGWCQPTASSVSQNSSAKCSAYGVPVPTVNHRRKAAELCLGAAVA
jgi:hypothetical protein